MASKAASIVQDRKSNKITVNKVIISLLVILFFVGAFKHISYPLIWNDEADTIMTAEKILEYGYPKVHDNKNIVFLPVDTTWIGYKKEYDANISMTWGCYYFATIGAYLSNKVDDIYLKTALLRIPFVAAGILGLFVFSLAIKDFFLNKKVYQTILIAFIIIELFSTILFLHLREARYYSLVILIVACFFYVLIQFYYYEKYSRIKYVVLMTLVLVATYHINIIAFFVVCSTLFLYELFPRFLSIVSPLWGSKNETTSLSSHIKESFLNLLPILICFVLIFPFLVFFETFSNSAKAFDYYNTNANGYLPQLERIVYILKNQEFLYAVVYAKAVQLAVSYAIRTKKFKSKSYFFQKNKLESLSLLMSVFFICFCLIVSKLPFLFTRYFIVLQPIMYIILLIDIVIILNFISQNWNVKNARLLKFAFFIILFRFAAIPLKEKISYQKNYIYQLTHQLKGPLDYIIPYIKENYAKTEDLVLATNYEELSYIYYLSCKVTLGACNKNLKEDLNYQPDIIVYRKKWGQDPVHYNNFIQKVPYNKVVFPVYDYPVNNIAEFYGNMEHQFKTLMAVNDADRTEMFVRINQ